ncbi:hypothetical protein Q3G72_024957 [Acer saccharum]|nr:hypothetical protein Q3G72_024957 [Acer saccharum]
MEKMWKTKGGVYVALLMMLVMILFINANPSRATSLVLKMSNNSSGSGCSSIHDCLITDDQSLEFLLGPEMATNYKVSAGAIDRSRPIVNCGRNNPYTRSCLPGSKNVKRGENCAGSNGQATVNEEDMS